MIEYDDDKDAVLNPNDLLKNHRKTSKFCILCFFNRVIEELEENKTIKKSGELNSPLGKHNLYEFKYKNIVINVFNPGLGGPMAAGFLEELIALGCKNFIAIGGAGVLDNNIKMGQLIIPIEAIRDEGTSYHYANPNYNLKIMPDVLDCMQEVLNNNGIMYIKGKTWTTDAMYRETLKKIINNKNKGCLTVEMEFASMLAVSLFRKVKFGQILYGGDNLDGNVWEYRGWRENENIQTKLFWLSADILYAMSI